MSWNFGVPVFDDGRAAEKLGHKVAEKVAEDKEHDCVRPVSEPGAYAE